VSLSFVQRGVERMPTDWTGASTTKKENTQLIGTLSLKHLAINKLNNMLVLFRVKPLLFLIKRAYAGG